MQSAAINPRIINVLAKQQAELVKHPLDGKFKNDLMIAGVVLYQNLDGDVADIQADIVGPAE